MRTMEFPLIEHELARTGRRYSTYALRTVAIGLLWLYMLLSLFMDWIMRQMANTESDELIMSFQYASMIQFGIVVLLTPILTANAIAREKQDRTFGLLTLANYRHYDVYLSKAASVMLHVGMLVLCFTPIQAIGVALGSIEGSELIVGGITVIATMTLVVAIGLLCSVLSDRPTDAVMMTYALVAAWYSLMIWVAVPINNALPDFFESATFTSLQYAFLCIIAAGALASWTLRLIDRLAGDAASTTRKRARWRNANVSHASGIAAIYRGAVRGLGSSWLIHPRCWVLLIVLIPLAIFLQRMVGPSLHWVVLFLVAYDVMSTAEASERQDTLDTLACSPVSDRACASALIRVHFSRSLVFLPAITLNSLIKFFDPGVPTPGNPGPIDIWQNLEVSVLGAATIVASDCAYLLFVVAASCFATTRPGGTARRMGFVVVRYFIVSFLASIGIIGVFIVYSVRGTLNLTTAPPLVLVATPLISAVLLGLFAYAYYALLFERIGQQWRNGGESWPVYTRQ